jgi:drug/metabolite transporter (DMT)-like permease
MSALTIPELLVIGSETILSLYPILIKLVPSTLATQVFSRIVTYDVAAGVLASPADWASTWGSFDSVKRSVFLGAITLTHIFVSYIAFSSLSAGTAMSLFYTYPMWNLLGAALFFGENIAADSYWHIFIGVIGTFLISTKGLNDEIRGLVQNRFGAVIGVVAALAAALTETAMYFAVRTNEQQNPISSSLELYGGALICLLPIIGAGLLKIQYTWKVWIPIVLFNLIVGFTGYMTRFYSIPLVKTEIFGLLSFTGVFSSFIFGFLFLSERPSLWSLVGAAGIAYAASRVEAIKSEKKEK